MASNIINYLWRHGINQSSNFSEEWAHDNWYDWEAVEKQLKVARGHIKDRKGKGIICKRLSTCLEAAYQDRKNNNKREQNLNEEIEGRKEAELILYLITEQLQKQV